MISSFGARFVRRLWIVCLAALFISLAAKSAYVCTSFPPTPWFNENVNLLNTNLPNGILIKQDGHMASLTNNLDTSSFYFNGYNGLQELSKSVKYSSSNNVLYANGYYVTALEPRNKIQDNRPKDVKLPEPQDTVVELNLDQKTYNIQLRISYTINEGYIPNSVYGFNNACRGYYMYGINLGFLMSGPVAIIVLMILLILIPAVIIIVKLNTVPDP